MIKLSQLDDKEKVKFVQNRWNSSQDVFSAISARKKVNLKIWQNNPEWLNKVHGDESKVRQNRIFMGLEHLNNFLLSRPSAPLILDGGGDDGEAEEFREDIHEFLLERNGHKEIKTKVKRAMRQLYLSRLFVLKMVWDGSENDFALRNVNVDDLRFSKDMSVIQEIVREPLGTMLERFPSSFHEEIMKSEGMSKRQVLLENPEVEYTETWASWGEEDVLIHTMNDRLIRFQDNPYWDYKGISLKKGQLEQLEGMNGRGRRKIFDEARRLDDEGVTDKVDSPKGEQYFFNFFDTPKKPYIIKTIFDISDSGIGETDFFEQANPLQEGVDRRKRQFDDNARLMNGVWLIDKKKTKLNRSQAQKLRADSRGYILADDAPNSIKRDTGKELPGFLRQDLEDSLSAIDDAIGTNDTFRGVREGQETAEGRAILREQALGRLDELITLVDSVYEDIYRWEFQMMKLKYTERHYVKAVGKSGAGRIFDILQDDLGDSLEIKVKPGQSLPEDRVFRSERAKEAFQAGTITPERYLEETGWENPSQLAKDALMFQQNPLSMVDMTEEDMARLQMGMQPPQDTAEQGGQDAEAVRAQQIAQVQQILESPEFQNAPPEEQARILDELEKQFPELNIPNISGK